MNLKVVYAHLKNDKTRNNSRLEILRLRFNDVVDAYTDFLWETSADFTKSVKEQMWPTTGDTVRFLVLHATQFQDQRGASTIKDALTTFPNSSESLRHLFVLLVSGESLTGPSFNDLKVIADTKGIGGITYLPVGLDSQTDELSGILERLAIFLKRIASSENDCQQPENLNDRFQQFHDAVHHDVSEVSELVRRLAIAGSLDHQVHGQFARRVLGKLKTEKAFGPIPVDDCRKLARLIPLLAEFETLRGSVLRHSELRQLINILDSARKVADGEREPEDDPDCAARVAKLVSEEAVKYLDGLLEKLLSLAGEIADVKLSILKQPQSMVATEDAKNLSDDAIYKRFSVSPYLNARGLADATKAKPDFIKSLENIRDRITCDSVSLTGKSAILSKASTLASEMKENLSNSGLLQS